MLTIQFGQCGNQLGHSLFSFISNDLSLKNTGVSSSRNENYVQESLERWFSVSDNKRVARAILVDTEKKVIDRIRSPSHWSYRPRNLVYQSSGGCANNWAYGYSLKGPQMASDILDSVNAELERADSLEAIFLLLSSAGGTGSGIGSYLVEQLRDRYPTKNILASVVLPFPYGEVGTQNYNTVLTLAKLQEHVDLSVIFENEQIHSICTGSLNNPEAKLPDINDVISKKLSAIFGPLEKTRRSVSSIISFVASHPDYKLANIKSAPYVNPSCSNFESASKWNVYGRNLKQTLRLKSNVYSKSAGNLLVTRGVTLSNDKLGFEEFKDIGLYPRWLTDDESFCHLHEQRRLYDQDKFVALLSNNSLIHKPLDAIVDKAWNTFSHSAFLHQYEKYGVEKENFVKAFSMMEKTIKSYKKLNDD